ncbi:hypothetical protein DID88_009162 [Monilinia fructigena]|uniref:VASt domain-containing protein n=1 Tax=Monilinia fructigena TaxID=38457 RepID=A0A395IHM6_9HELO|nr:hypothetical protein DID88_009162 [Monilinia fructigena]
MMRTPRSPYLWKNKVRNYSYIKPLNGAIGPKQTKCVSTETLDALDLEKAISVTISTVTPDVPSGNVFSTKTRLLPFNGQKAMELDYKLTAQLSGRARVAEE